MSAAGTGLKKEFSSSPWHYLTTHRTTNASKVKNWVMKFLPYPPYPLTNRMLFLQTF